jgi:hypothetical protein
LRRGHLAFAELCMCRWISCVGEAWLLGNPESVMNSALVFQVQVFTVGYLLRSWQYAFCQTDHIEGFAAPTTKTSVVSFSRVGVVSSNAVGGGRMGVYKPQEDLRRHFFAITHDWSVLGKFVLETLLSILMIL